MKEYFTNYMLHRSDVTFDLGADETTFHNRKSEDWRITRHPLHAWIEFGIAGPILITATLVMICKFLVGTDPYYRPFLTSLIFGATAIIFVGHGLWETWWIGLLGYVFGMASIQTNGGPKTSLQKRVILK